MSPRSVKILLIGDSGVGKTSILHRFTDDVFNPTFISTIGIDFKVKFIKIKGIDIKLQIWDTAGQERFQSMTPAYYRNADGIALIYDVTNEKSFENISNWHVNIDENTVDARIEKMLIANKCDLISERMISTQQVQQHASENQIDFLETSAKNGQNVDAVFQKMAERIFAKASHKNRGILIRENACISDATTIRQCIFGDHLQGG